VNVPFILPVTVHEGEIDELDHVNNLVYVKWIQEAAVAHSDALGLGLAAYLARGQAFVVRRHQIDYLRSALVGEAIEVETRVTHLGPATSTRQTEIRRAGTGEHVARAITGWAYIDLARGRPVRIPDDIKQRFPDDPPFPWADRTR
jgi:acyl-CoA thioester hydrolase